MREIQGYPDISELRSITPEEYMLSALQYFRRARWEAKGRFSCWVEEGSWYLAYLVNKSSIRILGIGVAPEKRSNGIGGKLLASLVEYGRSNGLKKITLRTRQEGREFLFYINHGFVPKTLKEDEIEMELDITNA